VNTSTQLNKSPTTNNPLFIKEEQHFDLFDSAVNWLTKVLLRFIGDK